ncbi:HAMP domain-containing histidine kinase [Shewanella insulae]|uniref:histidine kinase n=1 Tax=Shewanella insulae TaxID=2681496 RepID=A0A6L7HTY4_9GAMM|nr:HAMP domain-containing sensor histidine kinase [Shewanella insulae]MCG9738393.1 HAMP domain-containing histidine kinase [Shewanella insulae]MXR67769.1 histidine kinase [Shewanella insulae]
MATFIVFNIYLFYGLVFFSIGCVVVFRNFKYSQLTISPTLWALALFGFTHAFHEWSELYVILFADGISRQYQVLVEWLRLLKLALSFASLMVFAWLLFSTLSRRIARIGHGVIWLILLAYLVSVVRFSTSLELTDEMFAEASYYTRLLLGFGSAFLAGCGMAIYGYGLLRERHDYGQYFVATGGGLWLYGILAGLVATDLHMSIPVLRTLASGLVLVTLFKALKIFDIEREQQTEAKLKRAVETDKYKAIGQLAMGVAHEINNPLASSTLALDLLERKYPSQDPAQKEYMQRVRLGINRAAEISRELLAYARPASEEATRVRLVEVIGSAIKLLSHKQREFDIRVDCAHGLKIMGQKIKLEELLINLLNNAMDASDKGGKIYVEAVQCDTGIALTVKDEGLGMDEACRARALEPFYSTKAIGKGTGLGLAICESIVRAHRGTMRIESQPGQGTQISIVFEEQA